MNITNARAGQFAREVIRIELGIGARAWDRANIDERLDLVGVEEGDELVKRPRRMPDGIYSQRID